MSGPLKGVLACVAACIIWGCSGLFYAQLTHLGIVEIMAHRTIWTFVIFALVLALGGHLRAPFAALAARATFWPILLATALVGANWLIFVYAVQIDRAIDASMGYFMFPLVAVLLGRVFFGERLGPLQALAVALAGLAVAILTAGLGVAPWIALLLAITFGFYGLVKKRLAVGPVASVTAEALILLPPSLAWLIWLHAQGGGAFGATFRDSVLLVLSGPMVAAPLILFSYAATRISLTSLGLISYLNPSLQFLAATLILREPLGLWHATAFAIIWSALVLYTAAGLRQERALRRALSSSGTVSTSRK